MSSVFMIRIFLVVIVIVLLMLLLKLHKLIQLERRVGRYSLKMNQVDEDSYFDKLLGRYQRFSLGFKKNKLVVRQASRYEKYVRLDEGKDTIILIVNKLLIAIVFVLLVIISYAIQGKVLNFGGFIVSFIIGYYFYDLYLLVSQKRRQVKIKNDLLRAVIIMNNAFKAGKSTLQAVEIAGEELPKPIAYEFQKIKQDMSYGLSVDVAFQRFAKRVDLEEARYIASSLTILNKTGGNIVMVFSSIEKTLFDKKKLESDLKNSTAASNLVVKVLMIIPIIFVLFIYVISPSYFEPFFNSSLGYMVILLIGLMFAIYVYLLNKIMKVEV